MGTFRQSVVSFLTSELTPNMLFAIHLMAIFRQNWILQRIQAGLGEKKHKNTGALAHYRPARAPRHPHRPDDRAHGGGGGVGPRPAPRGERHGSFGELPRPEGLGLAIRDFEFLQLSANSQILAKSSKMWQN